VVSGECQFHPDRALLVEACPEISLFGLALQRNHFNESIGLVLAQGHPIEHLNLVKSMFPVAANQKTRFQHSTAHPRVLQILRALTSQGASTRRRPSIGALRAVRIASAPVDWRCCIAAATPLFLGILTAAAENHDWISTWTASSQPIWGADFVAPLNIPRSLRDQTVRQIATVTVGGKQVRLVLSNEYGSQPLHIGAAHVAIAGSGATIVPGSDRLVTFSGQPSVTIPPGAPVISDPVELTVPALGSLAVSLYFPEQTPLTTFHWEGVQTAYISPEGNFCGDETLKTDSTIKSRLFISGIMVESDPDARAIVTFGDSITAGYKAMADSIDLKLLTSKP
jgi:hypothetical protein